MLDLLGWIVGPKPAPKTVAEMGNVSTENVFVMLDLSAQCVGPDLALLNVPTMAAALGGLASAPLVTQEWIAASGPAPKIAMTEVVAREVCVFVTPDTLVWIAEPRDAPMTATTGGTVKMAYVFVIMGLLGRTAVLEPALMTAITEAGVKMGSAFAIPDIKERTVALELAPMIATIGGVVRMVCASVILDTWV